MNHHVAITIGKGFKAGVVGGVAPMMAAVGIDSATIAASIGAGTIVSGALAS